MKKIIPLLIFGLISLHNLVFAQVNKEQELKKSLVELQILQKNKDSNLSKIADTYNKIAKLSFSIKKNADALKYFKNELSIRNSLIDTGQNNISKSKVLFNIVELSRQLGEYESGLNTGREGIEFNKKYFGANSINYADALKTYSKLCFDSKRISQFFKSIDQALEVYNKQEKKDTLVIIDVMLLKAGGFIELANYSYGEKVIKEALEIYTKGKFENFILEGRIYNMLGSLSSFQNKHIEALNYFKKSLEIRIKGGGEKQVGVAWVYENIASPFVELKKYDDAAVYFNKALEIYVEILGDKSPKAIDVLSKIGNLQLIQGDTLKAKVTLEKILKTPNAEDYYDAMFFSLRNLAVIYNSEKNFEKSKAISNRALKFIKDKYGKNHPIVAEAYLFLGSNDLNTGDVKNALVNFKNSLESSFVSAKIPDKKIYLNAPSELLLLTENISDSLITDAFNISDVYLTESNTEADKEKMLNTVKYFYESVLYYYSKKDFLTLSDLQKNTILSCFESSKSVFLNYSMSESDALQAAKIPKDLESAYKSAKNLANYYESKWLDFESASDTSSANYFRKEAELLKLKSDSLLNQIIIKSPKLSLNFSRPTLTVKEVQNNIKKEQMILDLFKGEHFSFSLNIDKEMLGFKLLDSNKVNTLPVFLEHFKDYSRLEKNIKKSLYDYVNQGTIISQEIIPQNISKGIEHLIVIPDAIFTYLPFEALFYENVNIDKATFSNLPYMVNQYEISYAYNLSILFDQISSGKKDSVVHDLYAAAPLYSKESPEHVPLNGADKEVENLKNKFRGTFINKTKIKKSDFVTDITDAPDLLHLSMHGFAPDSSEAFLLFSHEKDKESRLFIHEIMMLDLRNTNFLILSACQTGTGTQKEGEGLMSIGRGFSYSGVNSMLYTLWPLHDKAASIITTSFYEYLDKGYSKTKALRLAKLDYLKEAGELNAHPIYWASLVLSGDDSAIVLPKKSIFEKWSYLWLGLVTGLTVMIFIFFRKK